MACKPLANKIYVKRTSPNTRLVPSFGNRDQIVHQHLTTHRVKAALLALLFVSAWLSKSAHGFFLHHHHDERPVCHAAYEKGQHLHDERYAGEDCSWCHFLLSVPEVLSITVALRPPAFLPDAAAPVFYSPICATSVLGALCLRGPPLYRRL